MLPAKFTFPTPSTPTHAQVYSHARLVNSLRVIGLHAGNLQRCGCTSKQRHLDQFWADLQWHLSVKLPHQLRQQGTARIWQPSVNFICASCQHLRISCLPQWKYFTGVAFIRMEEHCSEFQGSDLLCMLSTRIDAKASLWDEIYDAVQLAQQKVVLLQKLCNVQKMGLLVQCMQRTVGFIDTAYAG